MSLLPGFTGATIARFGILPLSGGLAALLILSAAACGGGRDNSATVPESPAAENPLVTVYASPTCGCCHQYVTYLEAAGFEVTSVEMEDLTPIKDSLGIPPDLRSCHTAAISEYFVEGHVPIEAIQKLLQERPPIDGITLPGMPSGSPGMGGDKKGPFMIYSIKDGVTTHFMTI